MGVQIVGGTQGNIARKVLVVSVFQIVVVLI